MLVHHLHQFIDNLSQTEPAESHYDFNYLARFKEKYSSSHPELVLSDVDMEWIESILSQRWQHVMDKLDYTFDSQSTNRFWIQLAKNVGSETGKPWINLLIPLITNELDPDLRQDRSQIMDPCDIFLSEDDKTWRSVKGIFRQLEADKQNLLTVKDDDAELRPLTLKELWRIRSKKHNGEMTFGNRSSFWDYLINDVVPAWNSTDKLHPSLPEPLIAAINIYLQTEFEKEKFDTAFSEFVAYLNTLSLAEQIYLYGIVIEHEDKKICLLDILLDCLLPEGDISQKLNAVSRWQQTNHSSVVINKPLARTDSSRQIFKYVDILNLPGLLDELPIVISSSFIDKLESLQDKINKNRLVGGIFVEQFKSLLALPWSEIIDEQDKASLLISEQYKSLWHYLISKTAPHGQQSGKLPVHLFHELLEIIDLYFQHSMDTDFSAQLNLHLSVFISNISACSLEDANHFYSVILEHNGRSIYLLEALLECFQQPDARNDLLKSVANLMYGTDPSLVGKNRELDDIYKQHQAGKFFNINKLNQLLKPLEINSEPSISLKLLKLKEMALKETNISKKLVDKIIELYALVWKEFIDSPEDYLRPGGVVNRAWITLAQHLAGVGILGHTNYYKLLIPTLSHDVDCITLQNVTMNVLPNYILSEDGSQLVFLRNSIEHHKNNGTFYNCNHEEPKPFSVKEKMRIRHSSQEFADYIDYLEENTDEQVIYKKTIMKVHELVEGSLYPAGLLLGYDYTDTQMTSAERAYKNFLQFVAGLPEPERNNLYKQNILLHGKLKTVAEVMKEVMTQDACIAVYGQFFIKLIVDYYPSIKFSKELEIKVDIDTLRLCSAKKVFRDYAHLTDSDAQRRLLIIFASLMTHPFKYVLFTGISLHVWDCINTVTLTGKEIFQILENCMANNFEDSRFVYASLMESIVKPALVEEGFLTSMVRYNDTRQWLQTIEDNSIFDPETTIFFDPGVLLNVLWTYVKNNRRSKLVVEPLLDQIVMTLAQNQHDHYKWLRINIKFAEFLSKQNDALCSHLLGKLRQLKKPVTNSLIIENTTDFVIHRLASEVARDPSRYYNFFKGNSSVNSIVYSSFSKLLKTNMDALNINDDISIHDLLERILGAANHLIGAFESSLLKTYIKKLTSLPVVIGNSHCSGSAPPVELIF